MEVRGRSDAFQYGVSWVRLFSSTNGLAAEKANNTISRSRGEPRDLRCRETRVSSDCRPHTVLYILAVSNGGAKPLCPAKFHRQQYTSAASPSESTATPASSSALEYRIRGDLSIGDTSSGDGLTGMPRMVCVTAGVVGAASLQPLSRDGLRCRYISQRCYAQVLWGSVPSTPAVQHQ